MANILAADDSVSIRQMVSHTLKEAGYQVETANDGADANRLADHDLVDAGGNVFHELALAHVRHTTGDFDVFVRAHHFGFGFFRPHPADHFHPFARFEILVMLEETPLRAYDRFG